MKQKFQVGDRVQIAKKYRNKHNSIIGEGTVLDIVSLKGLSRTVYRVKFDNKAFYSTWYSYELEKVVDNPKFKAGDKVMFSEKAKKWFDQNSITYDPQDVYIISKEKDGRYYLEYVTEYVFDEDDLELAKNIEFKVGDYVETKGGCKARIITIADDSAMLKTDSGWTIYSDLKNLKGVVNMNNERTVTLTLEKAKEWYKTGGELKEIALQAFTERELSPLPHSWEDFCHNFPIEEKEKAINIFGEPTAPKEIGQDDSHRCVYTSFSILPSEQYVTAITALMKLISLHKAWVGDWKPDFEMNLASNWTMEYHPNPGTWNIENHCWTNGGPLTFPTQELCKEFFECFKDLYEQAKILL